MEHQVWAQRNTATSTGAGLECRACGARAQLPSVGWANVLARFLEQHRSCPPS